MAEQFPPPGVDHPAVLMCLSNMCLPKTVIVGGGVRSYRGLLAEIEDGMTDGLMRVFPGQYDITPTRRLAWESWAAHMRRVVRERANGFAGMAHGEFYDSASKRDESFAGSFQAFDGEPSLASRLHQTFAVRPWRGVRGAFAGNAPKEAARSALASLCIYAGMPEVGALDMVARMSRQLGGVALTVYADHRDRRGHLMDYLNFKVAAGGAFAGTAVQIMPEAIEAAGDLQCLLAQLGERAIDGVVIDNHHLVRTVGPRSRAVRESVRAVAESGTLILGVHAAAGRLDARDELRRRESQIELEAILDGPQAIHHTLMGEIWQQAHRLWQTQLLRYGSVRRDLALGGEARRQERLLGGCGGYLPQLSRLPLMPVTLEVMHDALVQYRGEQLSRQDFVSMVRFMGQSIGSFFRELR